VIRCKCSLEESATLHNCSVALFVLIRGREDRYDRWVEENAMGGREQRSA